MHHAARQRPHKGGPRGADEETAAAGNGREAGLQAARDAFYCGDIAAAIAKFHAENGGWLSADDLAAFNVGVEAPVSIDYKGTKVYACGPWCQGPALPQALRLLDGFDLGAMGHNSPAYVHTLIEAIKLAFDEAKISIPYPQRDVHLHQVA